MTEDEKRIVDWLREREAWWIAESPRHDELFKHELDCNCSMECGEAITYRLIADAIEAGEHRGENANV